MRYIYYPVVKGKCTRLVESHKRERNYLGYNEIDG